jgi:hypothetical protein
VVANDFTWTGNPQATYGNASCNVGNNGTRSNTGNFAWVAAGSFLLCHRALLPLHVIAGRHQKVAALGTHASCSPLMNSSLDCFARDLKGGGCGHATDTPLI